MIPRDIEITTNQYHTKLSPHHIREQDLITIVLDDLRRVTHFARQKEKLFAEYINRKNSAELRWEITAEQKELAVAIPEKESRLEKLKASAANVEAFIEKAKRYTEIPELTPEILRLFISRIEVGERSEKYSRTAEQSIRIIYRDVGVMDSVEQIAEATENTQQANIA